MMHSTRVSQQQHDDEVVVEGEEASLLSRGSVCSAVDGGQTMAQVMVRGRYDRALEVLVMELLIRIHALEEVLERSECCHGYCSNCSSANFPSCLVTALV